MVAMVSRVCVNTCLLFLLPTAEEAAEVPGSLDFRTRLLSDRIRRLSYEDVPSSLDFELVLDVLELFTAGECDGAWCGMLQLERTIRWIDTRLSWLETRAGLSVVEF